MLLHGGLVDSRAWTHELGALADGFRVVAWDAPGCGQSSDPAPSFALSDYADVVAGLIEALGLGPSHVVGLSFGGGLALELYRRHAPLVASLVLVSAYAGGQDRRRRRLRSGVSVPSVMLADLPRSGVDEFLATLFDDSTPADIVARTREIMIDSRPEGMLPMLQGFAEADLRDVLGDVSVPTLLLYGQDDRRSPRPVAQALAAAIPRSRVVFVPGVGHEVNAEAPDAFEAHPRILGPGRVVRR